MPPWMITTIFVAAAIFVVVQIILHHIREKRRREELARVAADLGLEYHADGRGMLPTAVQEFPLFSKGNSRRPHNVLHGTIEDLDVYLLDYRYTMGTGKNATTYRQTVAVVGFDRPRFPQFEVRPERFMSKLAQLVGYQDIDFHTHPGFSKRYLVRGRDEHAVRNVLQTDLLDHLERHDKVCIEGGGHWLLLYVENMVFDATEMPRLLEQAFDMATRFTAHLAA